MYLYSTVNVADGSPSDNSDLLYPMLSVLPITLLSLISSFRTSWASNNTFYFLISLSERFALAILRSRLTVIGGPCYNTTNKGTLRYFSSV